MIEQKAFDLESEKKPLLVFEGDSGTYRNLAKQLGIEAEIEEAVTSVPTLGKLASPKVHIVSRSVFDDEQKRKDAFKSIQSLEGSVLALIDTLPRSHQADWVEQLFRAGYRFTTFKSEEADVLYYYPGEADPAQVEEGAAYGEAINKARDLINTPYSHLNATDLAEYAESLTAYANVEVEVLDKEACEQLGMGAFLGVNAGSKHPPRLIRVAYRNGGGTPPTALVGKGIMYDTGGYSLKSVQGMPGMKMDMGGAASVLAAMEAIARLGRETNVDAVVAATDNRIGDDAHVPDDVLKSAAGKTIEIISTDAEGRLPLADAVWFAKERGAERIIDVATLTGAVVGALGKHHVGAFSNDDDFYEAFRRTAENNREKIWRLPVDEAHHETLKSKVADIKNSGGRPAAASLAAAFIETFVGETPWIHLDIAGTAFEDKVGATGVMVKSLADHFRG